MKNMKIMKSIMAIFVAINISAVSVYAADTYDASYKVEIKDGIVSVTEDELYSEKDNSDLLVKVIKQVGDESTEIFSGKLKDYDNGKWVNTNFSEIQFMIIFEWDGPSDEAIYVIPVKDVSEKNSKVMENSMQMISTTPEIIQPSLNIVENFYINNNAVTGDFSTQNIKGNDNLLASYSITNFGTKEQSVQLILCVYSLEGKMLDIAVVSDTIASNETKDVEKGLTVGANVAGCYAKVFLWDGLSTLRPLHDTLQIGSQDVSVEVATATVYCVLNKEYNLVTTVENMPTNDDGQYTITYNPSKLELIDLCSLTYKKELTIGTISGTNIIIVSVDTSKGEIVFKNPNTGNGNVSKVLNAFKFKGLVSDEQTTITIE